MSKTVTGKKGSKPWLAERNRARAVPLEIRFWSKVVADSDGCWAFTGSLDRHGYGQIWCNPTQLRAHRVAWELLKGPLPSDLVIDHLCRNRRCVNPDHMEPVTPGENVARGNALRPGLRALLQKEAAAAKNKAAGL